MSFISHHAQLSPCLENTCWFKSVFSQHAHLSLCVCRTQSLQASLQNIVLKRVIYSPFISLHSMLTAAVDKSSLTSSLSVPQKPGIVCFFKSLCLVLGHFQNSPRGTVWATRHFQSLSRWPESALDMLTVDVFCCTLRSVIYDNIALD